MPNSTWYFAHVHDIVARHPLLPALLIACVCAVAACGEERAPALIERSVPWELQLIEGPRLTLQFKASACAGEDFSAAPRVEEGPERVRIAVIARRRAAARCAGFVRIGRLRVTLQAPLGDRSLVHAPVTVGGQPGGDDAISRCPPDRPPGESLDARRLVGLTLTAARDLAAGSHCTVRVIERDGRALARTGDFRRDRINVVVRNGHVLQVSIG